ncbi:MAG: hypothetical protein JXR53_04135 [Bacteroidales bacterium]|nr:hypothetical protein [Bacteroidales bacterium]
MKKFLQILLLSRTYTLTCSQKENEFITGLKKFSKASKLSGRFSKSKMNVIFMVGLAKWMPLPAISIKGFVESTDNKTILHLKMRVSLFIGFFLIGGPLVVLAIYFLELFGEFDFGGISNSPLILIFPVATYLILILLFLAFSASCKWYFDELIYKIESNK